MPHDVFHGIYSMMQGVTWYVQSVLSRIYENAHDEITTALVEHCINELIDEQEDAYRNYVGWMTANQAQLIRAIAQSGIVATPLAQSFIKKYNLPATSSNKTALKSLLHKQLIVHYTTGYKVNGIFFAMWLNRQ